MYSNNLAGSVGGVRDALDYGLYMSKPGFDGIMLIFFTIVVLFCMILAFAMWILEAIPVYKLAKKTGRPMPWLAWIPVFGSYFRMYVIADIPGKKEVNVFNKWRVESRSNMFWIYAGIKFLGSFIISIIVSVCSFIIPVIGSLSAVLYLLPMAATGIIEYIFFKELLDVFKSDQQANSVASIVVTILDKLVTGGLARTVYLYTLLKLEPIENTEFIIAE